MSEPLSVVVPRSLPECEACAGIQEDLEPPVPAPIPAWFLWELARSGAAVLAAHAGEGFPVGLAVALPREGALRLALCGVRRGVPDLQGILRELVGALLARARDLGFTEVVWPLDPLEPEWIGLALGELKGIARGYELHRGRGGEIRRFRTLAAITAGSARRGPTWRDAGLGRFLAVNRTRVAPGGVREPEAWNRHLTAPLLLMEIPGEGVSRLPAGIAARWREAWEVLEGYMDRGYALVGLFRQRERAFLVLERVS